MIADALNGQPRSLVQYAEELRAEFDLTENLLATGPESRGASTEFLRDYREKVRHRLLAVEREINWRMGI